MFRENQLLKLLQLNSLGLSYHYHGGLSSKEKDKHASLDAGKKSKSL
jgi:hypothetical protein